MTSLDQQTRKTRQALLGIDVGTTAVHAGLFDRAGVVLADATAEHGTQYPEPNAAVQDPLSWWNGVRTTVNTVLQQAADTGASIEVLAVAVSSQAPTVVCLDEHGDPLLSAVTWADRRSGTECREIQSVLSRTGLGGKRRNPVDPYYALPKLLWIRRRFPELYARTRWAFLATGFINYKLCGAITTDHSHAGLTLLYDWERREWDLELCRALSVSPEILPPVVDSHTIIGEVSSAAARETGLTAGTPVIAGTVDGTAAAIEAGAVSPEVLCDMSGTSTVVLAPSRAKGPAGALTVLPHAVSGQDLLIGTMSCTGGSLKWFRNALWSPAAEVDGGGSNGAANPYEAMDREANRVGPDPSGIVFLPYLMGERSPIWDSDARGVFFGLQADTSRGQLIRAIMEGGAFALRHNLEVMEHQGVSGDAEIRVVGGVAKSRTWCELKAHVAGRTIVAPRASFGAVFGDALLAGFATGIYRDLAEAVEQSVVVTRRYEPDPALHEQYSRLFTVYKELYENTKQQFASLAGYRAGGKQPVNRHAGGE